MMKEKLCSLCGVSFPCLHTLPPPLPQCSFCKANLQHQLHWCSPKCRLCHKPHQNTSDAGKCCGADKEIIGSPLRKKTTKKRISSRPTLEAVERSKRDMLKHRGEIVDEGWNGFGYEWEDEIANFDPGYRRIW